MEQDSEMIKEVAKTTGKAIDATRDFGKFISKYLNQLKKLF